MDSFHDKISALEKYKNNLYTFQDKEAETLFKIGELYLDEDEPEKALENLQEAKKIYQKIKNPEGEAYTYDLMGDAYLSTRNITPAKKHYQKAFHIFGSLDSPLKSDLFEKIQGVEKVEQALKIIEEKRIDKKESNFKEK